MIRTVETWIKISWQDLCRKGKCFDTKSALIDTISLFSFREDFDVEHDNDAELILADMEFNEDDHPSEVKLNKNDPTLKYETFADHIAVFIYSISADGAEAEDHRDLQQQAGRAREAKEVCP